MISEDRLRHLLRADALGYGPAADPAPLVEARMARRRFNRIRARSGMAIGAVLCTVAVVVPLVASSGGGHGGSKPLPSPPISAPAPVGADRLVEVSETSVSTLSASTGALLSSIAVTPPLASMSYGGTIAVSGVTQTAYVNVATGVSCFSTEILAIDLRTGHDSFVTEGEEPAISPDGRRLAYITSSSDSCQDDEVVVKDLASGAVKTWRVAAPPPNSGARAQVLSDLSWEPDGRHLIVGSNAGPYTGIQILDTASSVRSGNPVTVGPEYGPEDQTGGRYEDAEWTAGGRIVAVAPRCWGGMSCPPSNGGVDAAVVSIDVRTGDVVATLYPAGDQSDVGFSGLLVDGRGRLVALVGYRANQSSAFYRLSSGGLVTIAPATGEVGIESGG